MLSFIMAFIGLLWPLLGASGSSKRQNYRSGAAQVPDVQTRLGEA
jgi:hypothetical protein